MIPKNLVVCGACGGNRFINARTLTVETLASGAKTRNWQSSPEDANYLQCADPACAVVMVWDHAKEMYIVKSA